MSAIQDPGATHAAHSGPARGALQMDIPYLDHAALGNEDGYRPDVRRLEGRSRQLGCHGVAEPT